MTVDAICKKVKISRNAYYEYLEINGLKGKVRKYKKE
jgi:ACT domain-containing protein